MNNKYLDQYKQLHQNNNNYGKGLLHFEYIKAVLNAISANNVIDFGCGKGVMANALNETGMFKCAKYDPSIPKYSTPPTGHFDALINTDVLEHIPDNKLDGILKVMEQLSDIALIIPHLDLAVTILPDGTNAHCTIKSPNEWNNVLSRYWPFVTRFYHHSSKHAFFICSKENKSYDSVVLLTAMISGTEFQKNITASMLRRFKVLPNMK